jgi:hypothetical protein
MKEFFKNKFAHVYYDEALDALFLKYTDKVPNHDEFMIANQALLDAFLSLNTQKFAVDIRKMGIISLQSQEWVVKTLIPTLLKHLKGETLYHVQLLDTSEILSKVSASNIKNKSSQVVAGFEITQVTTEAELNQYLRDVLTS